MTTARPGLGEDGSSLGSEPRWWLATIVDLEPAVDGVPVWGPVENALGGYRSLVNGVPTYHAAADVQDLVPAAIVASEDTSGPTTCNECAQRHPELGYRNHCKHMGTSPVAVKSSATVRGRLKAWAAR